MSSLISFQIGQHGHTKETGHDWCQHITAVQAEEPENLIEKDNEQYSPEALRQAEKRCLQNLVNPVNQELACHQIKEIGRNSHDIHSNRSRNDRQEWLHDSWRNRIWQFDSPVTIHDLTKDDNRYKTNQNSSKVTTRTNLVTGNDTVNRHRQVTAVKF